MDAITPDPIYIDYGANVTVSAPPSSDVFDATQLAEMLSNAEAASRKIAAEENIEVEWEKDW